ncbi:MAG: efflux RND transporter periplasmic adaptor subunit [Geminicoccaceae bacterium]
MPLRQLRAIHGAGFLLSFLFLVQFGTPALSQQAGAPVPKVLVAEASLQALGAKALFIGRIEATQKVELRARVTGFLREVTFGDGDRVNADQLLFEIERAPFEATVAMRQAQVSSAEARLRNAAIDLERQQKLVARKATSQAALDQAIAENGMAKAATEEAKAALQQAEIDLSYTRVASPIDGRIGKNIYDIGNLVGPESGVLATVVQDDPAQAYFEVTQRQLIEAREKIGDAPLLVTAQLANGMDYEHKGKIDFFDVTVNPRTDGQLVRAVFANPDRILTDGQSVRIRIEEAAPSRVLSIPLEAVSADQTGSFVLLVNAEDKVERRSVTLGPQDAGLITVIDGLGEGDRVIVQGQLRVRPGMQVDAVRAEEAGQRERDS